MPHREPVFRLAVGATVTFLWAASTVVDFFVPMYDPPPGMHSLMMVVAGGLFGSNLVSAARREARKGDDSSE